MSAAIFEELSLIKEVDESGNIFYYNSKGQLHREHGPAVIYYNGDMSWLYNGCVHRTNGPAIDWEGVRGYYLNDKLFENINAYNSAVEKLTNGE